MSMIQTTDERLIAQLFDTQPDSVVWFKPIFAGDNSIEDFEVKYCNTAACTILHVPRSTLIGSTLMKSALMDDVSRQRIFEQCCQVWNSEESIEFTYHSPGLDSYFNVQRSKVQDGILSITRDRTELVKNELEKQKQADLLNNLIEHSPYGVCLYESIRDSERKIVDFKLRIANRKSAEITQLTMEQLYGNTVKQLMAIRGNWEYFDICASVVETGKPQMIEFYSKTTGKWLAFSIVKFNDGYLLNYIDISLTKQLEQQTKQQAYMLESVLDASITGLFSMEAVRDENGAIVDFRFTRVNNAGKKILGLTDDLIGRQYLSVFPNAKPAGIFDLHVKVMQTGEPVNMEFHYNGEGYDGWYSICITKMGDDGVVQSFNDITNLLKAQRTLEQKVKELERSNSNLEEFAYAASHDLQEPLRKIVTFLSRIKVNLKAHIDESSDTYFERIESSVLRMRELIDDLLQFSDVSFREETFSFIPLNNVMAEVLSDMELMIEEKQAIIQTDHLPSINGIHRQMKQMFQNLVSNALKYTRQDVRPEIIVSSKLISGYKASQLNLILDTTKTYHHITVTDNGIGFQQEYSDKIFQIFQRLHGRSEYSGTGVGLAIVKKVVENHNGYITAEGTPGVGATFNIILPVE